MVEIGLEYSNQVANAVLDTDTASASWAAHAVVVDHSLCSILCSPPDPDPHRARAISLSLALSLAFPKRSITAVSYISFIHSRREARSALKGRLQSVLLLRL